MSDRIQPTERHLFSLAQIQHLMRVEFDRAQRYGYPVSCMFLAVDRLGHLRDLYGYDAKEEILASVIELLKRETRASDFLGRTADDRLVVVVPHTGREGMPALLDRLIAGVARLEFNSEGRSIPITVSIGVSVDDKGEALFFDAMFQAAGEALADAIERGGGRAVLRNSTEIE